MNSKMRKLFHVGFIVELVILGVLVAPAKSSTQEESVNRFCAYVVGIPYASDNFTDDEWERFKFCREILGDT